MVQILPSADGGLLVSEYVDELAHQHRLLVVTLERQHDFLALPPIDAKVHQYFLGRSSAFVFWELSKFSTKIAMHVKDPLMWYKKNMRRVWMGVLQQHGVPVDHVQLRQNLPAADVVGAQCLSLHGHQVSTHALIVLLLYWYTRIPHVGAKVSCRGTLFALQKMLPAKVVLPIDVAQPTGGRLAVGVELEDGMLRPAPVLALHTCRSAASWPHKEQSLADAMVAVYTSREAPDLLHSLLVSFSDMIDLAVRELPDPKACQLAKLADSRGRLVDAELRQAIAGQARNKWVFGRVAGMLDASLGMHTAKLDRMDQYRYLLATIKAMHGGTTWATALDGVRFSGKDFYKGFIMNTGTSLCAWLPPQVRSLKALYRFFCVEVHAPYRLAVWSNELVLRVVCVVRLELGLWGY